MKLRVTKITKSTQVVAYVAIHVTRNRKSLAKDVVKAGRNELKIKKLQVGLHRNIVGTRGRHRGGKKWTELYLKSSMI